MPHYAASAAPGLRITSPLTSNAWQHRKRIKTKPRNKIVFLVEIRSAACSCWHRLQQSGKVPGRRRTDCVYAASYQSNMRRNDTIQSVARMPPFRCDQNPDKTCSTSSRTGANSTHVTNSFDLSVATPVFPHWVNNGSGSQQKKRWPSSFMSSHTESIMR